MAGLIGALGTSAKEFDRFTSSIWRYRSKFVAHLDDERTMQFPTLRGIRKSAKYLYERLLHDPAVTDEFADAPTSATGFYSYVYRLAVEQHRAADRVEGARRL